MDPSAVPLWEPQMAHHKVRLYTSVVQSGNVHMDQQSLAVRYAKDTLTELHCRVWNLVCHIKGRTYAEGVREWGAEVDIWV